MQQCYKGALYAQHALQIFVFGSPLKVDRREHLVLFSECTHIFNFPRPCWMPSFYRRSRATPLVAAMTLYVPQILRTKRTGALVFILWRGKPCTTLPGKPYRVPFQCRLGTTLDLRLGWWGVSAAVDTTESNSIWRVSDGTVSRSCITYPRQSPLSAV